MKEQLTENEVPSVVRSLRQRVFLVLSTLLCLGIGAIYIRQPDALAGVTLIPAWCWLLPAYVLLRCGFNRNGMNRTQRVWSWAALVLWVAFTLILVDELPGLVRGIVATSSTESAPTEQANQFRVVTANCAQGNTAALAETLRHLPDILLLQESPSRETLQKIVDEEWETSDILYGPDTSILTRGKITPVQVPPNTKCTIATVELPSGHTIHVVSLRLSPPPASIEFWTANFWQSHCDNRLAHREELTDILLEVARLGTKHPVLIGGDFNLQPRDGALDTLRERYTDAFRAAGHGWGHTGTNRFPLFRVDQIWLGPGLKAVGVTAEANKQSDHRQVVCDIEIQ